MAELGLIVLRTAATDLDLQGRVTGRLDLPLSEQGKQRAKEVARQLQWEPLDLILRAPCLAAAETTEPIAQLVRVRVKVETELANVDFGLWHGRRLDDLKQTLPTAFRCWSEHPERLQPPKGESIHTALERARALLVRLERKYSGKTLLLVTPPPFAALLASLRSGEPLAGRWCQATADGAWQVFGKSEDPIGREASPRKLFGPPTVFSR